MFFFFQEWGECCSRKKSESWEENISFSYMKLFLSTNSVLLLILKEKHHLSYHVQPLLRIAGTIRHRCKWILYIQYILSVISLYLCKYNCIIRYQKTKWYKCDRFFHIDTHILSANFMYPNYFIETNDFLKS